MHGPVVRREGGGAWTFRVGAELFFWATEPAVGEFMGWRCFFFFVGVVVVVVVVFFEISSSVVYFFAVHVGVGLDGASLEAKSWYVM